MCGLAGFTSPDKNKSQILSKMLATINYRGPDSENVYFDSSIAFGHLRLAVVDIDGGSQPRIGDSKQPDALIYNGEIYGYKKIGNILRQESIPLRDNSDTEVLFWLLKTKGVDNTLKQIDGMFAFAYRPKDSKVVYLARDRFGEKPLFYAINNGQLIFASEINAILQHPLFENRSLDKTAISQYLTLEYIPGENTGVEGVYKVPPGHIVQFENGQINKKCYWRPVHNKVKINLPDNKKLQELEQLLVDSVKERLIADVPVGVFLSGGLDSSLIAAIAAREKNDISAFTIKMPQASFDESKFAKSTADYLGLKHNIFELTDNDLLYGLEKVSAKIDQPFADSSIIPTFLVCQHAKHEVTVALGGDGADELFAGYPNFKMTRFTKLMERLPAITRPVLQRLLMSAPDTSEYMSYSFLMRQLSYGFGKKALFQPIYWMSAFSIEEQADLWMPEFLTVNSGLLLEKQMEYLLHESNKENALESLLYLFSTMYLPDDILTKVDRAAMYNSLEVRSPYLEHKFSEYVLSLPMKDKLTGFDSKVLLKKLALRYLPNEIVTRKKHGFALPIANLIRGAFKDRIEMVLFDQNNPVYDWFCKGVIKSYWNEHQGLRRNHGKKIWTLYTLFCFANNVLSKRG
tara:strand:- start:3485 stop:5377 length:1893 start_codon:yes stop_codon:yes gene_type:complete